jgi:nicotinamide phosphoribosyltransferase
MATNPFLLADYYKIGHIEQYPEGTEVIYSTWTPRTSRIKGINKVVMFGLQGFIKKYLVDYFNENFFHRPKTAVIGEYRRFIKHTLGIAEPKVDHLEALHDLQYLPIEIKAVKEGTLVPLRVPMLTIHNTRPDLVDTYWITNFLETLMSAELWQPMTIATLSKQYRTILDRYALETTGSTDGVEFQAHDFSLRGMAGVEAGKKGGVGHLLSFVGTDSMPAIDYAETYYGANIEHELVGTSIPATEHSVMCANSDPDSRDEYESFRRLVEDVYPSGFCSIVSDTYDFWKVVGEILPKLKDSIMNRDGKVVIRPDSGDPVQIICGSEFPDLTGIKYCNNLENAKDYFYEELMDELRENTPHGEYGDEYVSGKFKYDGKYYELGIEVDYDRYDKQYYFIDSHREKSFKEFTPKLSELGLIEALWNIFSGTTNSLGYKLLDPHIGAIYGDSITLERAEEICRRLKAKGFASVNIVFGVGSFTMQYNTRDTFGFAMKATYAVVNGEEKELFKDPKTDNGTKRSQRGMVAVVPRHAVWYDEDTVCPVADDAELTFVDGLDSESYKRIEGADLLETVFKDGRLVREQSLSEIRKILAGA